MKTIYQFKVYDIGSDQYKKSEAFGTKEYIGSINGASLIHGTEKEVDEIFLDADGRLIDTQKK